MIYTLAIETDKGITTGSMASDTPIDVGMPITVHGHDQNGVPFSALGIVVEILEASDH
jgi:hypothetical protein